MSWAEIRYKVADRLFERELDEAFDLGRKAGRQMQAAHLRVQMDYKRTRNLEMGMTKTQALGYDRCMEVVTDALS